MMVFFCYCFRGDQSKFRVNKAEVQRIGDVLGMMSIFPSIIIFLTVTMKYSVINILHKCIPIIIYSITVNNS